MNKKEKALKIAVIVLGVLAVMDIFRGYMHTFNIWYASENVAQMTQTPDTMNLMNVFGVSNFLTAFIYFIVIKKAKEIAPYILIAIPTSYLIGIISSSLTGVSAMQQSSWNGQYMMYGYLIVSFIVGLNYILRKNETVK